MSVILCAEMDKQIRMKFGMEQVWTFDPGQIKSTKTNTVQTKYKQNMFREK